MAHYLSCKNCKATGDKSCYNEIKAEITCTRCGFVILKGILDEQSEWRSFGADISTTGGVQNDRNRIGQATSDLREDEGLGTILTGGTGEITNISRKINQSVGNNAGEKFEKCLLVHISKLKLESLKDPSIKLFVEYNRKINNSSEPEENKEISTRDLAFAILYIAMQTEKKKVLDIDTMLDRTGTKKRNYNQAMQKVLKYLPESGTEMKKRDAKPLIESYFKQIFNQEAKKYNEVFETANMLCERFREKGTMGARHKQTISLICLYTGVYYYSAKHNEKKLVDFFNKNHSKVAKVSTPALRKGLKDVFNNAEDFFDNEKDRQIVQIIREKYI